MRLEFRLSRLIVPILAFAVVDICATNVAFAEATRLAEVEHIYVGGMGSSDEGERFRLLVADALRKKGFATVETPDKADATLSGAVTVTVYANDSQARATVSLKNAEGNVLWADDVGPGFHMRVSDTVKKVAGKVAERIADARKEARKK